MPYTLRPARMHDASAVVDICNASTQQVQGIQSHSVERRRTDWQQPDFDLESDTRIIDTPNGVSIAYACVTDRPPHDRIRGDYYIRPEWVTPELQRLLLEWLETRARHSIALAPARSRVVITHHTLAQDKDRAKTLTRCGYVLVHHSWRMRMTLTTRPIMELPKEILIRPMDRDKDLPAISRIQQESFRHHWGFVQRGLDEDVARLKHWLDSDTGIDPAGWLLAYAKHDAVGICLGTPRYSSDTDQAYIYTLGVRDAWRRRGIGRALLMHAFAAFHSMGRRVVDLDVDTVNPTGALRLYEGVGMVPLWQIDEYEKELRPQAQGAT